MKRGHTGQLWWTFWAFLGAPSPDLDRHKYRFEPLVCLVAFSLLCSPFSSDSSSRPPSLSLCRRRLVGSRIEATRIEI
ncbi:hypothetical protein C4D60_Mb03t04340 [Musa balbisiana]|uniref:Uncharacterized protein n=1 Tax=Musa balbisiana TaxID=52838 RepID=A0A4S8J7T3_MUSBA|nr:hypothetical protein C4D60_Mb03t04340 [Musa balbisiana]